MLSLWACTPAVSLSWQPQEREEGRKPCLGPLARHCLCLGASVETRLSLVVGCEERGGLRHGPLLPITLKGTNYVLFSTWKEEVGVSSCFSALKGEWLSQQSIASNFGRSSTLSGLIARFPLLELSQLLPSTSLGLC